jgi:hypothetical protein
MLRDERRWRRRPKNDIFGSVDRFGAQSRGERHGTVAVSAATVPLGSGRRIRTDISARVISGVLPLDEPRKLKPIAGRCVSWRGISAAALPFPRPLCSASAPGTPALLIMPNLHAQRRPLLAALLSNPEKPLIALKPLRLDLVRPSWIE